MELHIVNPKRYMSLKFYTQRNTWHQKLNFLTQKNTRLKYLNTDLFNQTFRSNKKIFSELIADNFLCNLPFATDLLKAE